MPDSILFVLSATYAHFEAWCLDNDRHPRDPMVRFIYKASDLHGMKDFEWTTYGPWDERRDANEVWRTLTTRIGATRIDTRQHA